MLRYEVLLLVEVFMIPGQRREGNTMEYSHTSAAPTQPREFIVDCRLRTMPCGKRTFPRAAVKQGLLSLTAEGLPRRAYTSLLRISRG